MTSPDVVASALLLAIPLVSFPLAVYNWIVHRSTPTKSAVLFLLAILAAVSGGSALSVACGEPLRIVAGVFANLLHATLSSVSIYALSPSCQTRTFSPFLGFFLSLASILVAGELICSLIPTSPRLSPAVLALVSRSTLLVLATTTAVLSSCRQATTSGEIHVEKGRPTSELLTKTPGRVSSPTQATWPFPGSLALQDQQKCAGSPPNKSTPPYFPSSTFIRSRGTDKYSLFATLSAALNVATSAVRDGATSQTNQPRPPFLLASAVCTLLWSFTVLAIVQVLPAASRPFSSEKRVVMGYEQRLCGDISTSLHGIPVVRTPNPSLSRRESSSLDFLSLRDPFASSPPPPPPLPPIGLGLDEVEVGWDGNKEIGMQYRFPAPRSIIKGGRRKGKIPHVNGKKRLVHQDSARTLLPVPETRGTEADVGGEKEFGDEVRLAQLLLQSLCEGGEDPDLPGTSAPVAIVQPPQAAHVQQSSRWSTSTTVQSVSASISNRSGVSTYTTCASDKVPTSRFSMNTIASALGSRKSSEAKRKSAMTASSSKGEGPR